MSGSWVHFDRHGGETTSIFLYVPAGAAAERNCERANEIELILRLFDISPAVFAIVVPGQLIVDDMVCILLVL